MKRFIEGDPRKQSVLFPERLDEWIGDDNPVRAVDAFVEELELKELGFASAEPAATGRPAYHPGTLLKIYIYGYLNRIQSARRLERESQRNVELIWLTGRLAPDFKTLADFRRDNGLAIQKVCARFVQLCRDVGLFSHALIAIDGSKFKAVNNRDRNFTPHKLQAQRQQLERSAAHYLEELDRADRDPSLVPEERVEHLAVETENHLIVAHDVVNQGHDRSQLVPMAQKGKEATGEESVQVLADRGYFDSEQILKCEQSGVETLIPKPMTSNARAAGRFDKKDFKYDRERNEYRCPAGQRAIWRLSAVDKGLTIHKYWSSACPRCPIRGQCTTSKNRRISRWEHEDMIDVAQDRLAHMPLAGRLRRQTVEHAFGTLKSWMGATHFLMRRLPRVRTEISLHVLAYNLKRVMKIMGTGPLIEALRP
jgi:transposase